MRIKPYMNDYNNCNIIGFNITNFEKDYTKVRFLGEISNIKGLWMMNLNRNLVFVNISEPSGLFLRDLEINDCYRISRVHDLKVTSIKEVLLDVFNILDNNLIGKCIHIHMCTIKKLGS